MLLWATDVSGPEHDSTFELLREIGYAGVEIPIFEKTFSSPLLIAFL